MDFFTTHDSPVTVKIDGKAYSIPRFLIGEFELWADIQRQAQIDEATAELDKEQKAKFLAYYAPVPVDLLQLFQTALTPAGVKYIIDKQFGAGGVPKELRDKVLKLGSAPQLRNLVTELTRAPEVTEALRFDDKETTNPLSPPPGTSKESASTGASTENGTMQDTPATIAS